jgi:hypothetical protein
MAAVTFNAGNGQLEVDPDYWDAQPVFPDSIQRLLNVGDKVAGVDTVLGRWNFSKQTTLPPDVVCPETSGWVLKEWNAAFDPAGRINQKPAQIIAYFEQP